MERIVLKELLSDFIAQVLEAVHPAMIEAMDDLISNELAQKNINDIMIAMQDSRNQEPVFPRFYYQIGESSPVLIEPNPVVVKMVDRALKLIAGPAEGGGKRSMYTLLKKTLQMYGKLPSILRVQLVKLGTRISLLRFNMRYVSLEEIERRGIPGVKIHPKALCWTLTGVGGLFRSISSCGMIELNVGKGWSEKRRDDLLSSMTDLISPLFPTSKMLLHNTFHPEDKTRFKLFGEEFREKAPTIMESSLRKYGYFNLVETKVSNTA
jgi:hypothetical protein